VKGEVSGGKGKILDGKGIQWVDLDGKVCKGKSQIGRRSPAHFNHGKNVSDRQGSKECHPHIGSREVRQGGRVGGGKGKRGR